MLVQINDYLMYGLHDLKAKLLDFDTEGLGSYYQPDHGHTSGQGTYTYVSIFSPKITDRIPPILEVVNLPQTDILFRCVEILPAAPCQINQGRDSPT